MSPSEISPVMEVLVALCTAGVLTLVLIPTISAFAVERGFVVQNGHSLPIPSLGGTVLVIATVGAALIAASASGWRNWDIGLIGLICAALVAAAVGLRQDVGRANTWLNAYGQSAAVALLVISGLRPHLFGSAWIDSAIGAVWMVIVANAFAALDDSDGTMGVAGLATSAVLAGTAYSTGNLALTAVMTAVAAACAGYLWHGWPPARISMGRSGSLFLGFLFGGAALAILDTPAAPGAMAALAWMLLLPFTAILNAAVIVVSRARTRDSVLRGRSDHLTHRLLALSFTATQQVLLVGTFTVITAELGLLVIKRELPPAPVLLTATCCLIGLVTALQWVRASARPPTPYLPPHLSARLAPTATQSSPRRSPSFSPSNRKGSRVVMGIPDYLRAIRNRWQLVVAAVVVAIAAAGILTAQTTPQYASTVTLFISAPGNGGSQADSAYQAGLLSQQRVKSYAELLGSRAVAEALIKELGSPIDPTELLERITVETQPDSVLLRATVTDPSRDNAQRTATVLGTSFARLVQELERTTTAGPTPIRVTTVGVPEVTEHPVTPKPLINLAAGLFLGLAAGVGGALLRESLDTSIRSVETARQITGSPSLGVVRYDRATPTRPLLTHIDRNAPRAEAFRTLRTNLRFLAVDHPIRTVLITSCQSGEGKSTTACNLALSMIEAGSRVALIDGDLRRPRLAEYLGTEGAAGLTSVLIGQAELDDVLQPWGRDGLLVLPSGPMPPNPAELLGSQRMAEIVAQVAARVDVVLIDAPPLLPVTDAAILSSICDGVLLVVRHGRTKVDELRQATNQLNGVGARILGHVISMAPNHRSNHYGYGHVYREQVVSQQAMDEAEHGMSETAR